MLAGKQQVCTWLPLKSSAPAPSCSSAACPGAQVDLGTAGLEGNTWRKQRGGCLHSGGLGVFLFTTARGPGMFLAPHLLLDALSAAVAKIVISPSASAPSPAPRASFREPIPLPLCLCPLPRDRCVCSARPGLIPGVLGWAVPLLYLGNISWNVLCRWLWPLPHSCRGSLGVPKVGGCYSHWGWAGRLLSCVSSSVILHGQTPSLQSWPDSLTS